MQYAWDSVPIDNTDIPRSVTAIGRHFKLPMDIKLSNDPLLNDDDNIVLYSYLRDVSLDSTFATYVLQISIE